MSSLLTRHSRLTFSILSAALLSLAVQGCGRSVLIDGSEDASVGPEGGGEVTLLGLEVAPTEIQLAVGAEVSLRSLALYSDGSSVNVTEMTDWVSADAEVATVNEEGVVIALSGGVTTITGSFEDVAASATIEVLDTTEIVDLRIEPSVLSLPLEASGMFIATAELSDGTSQVVNDLAAWEFIGEELGSLENGEVVAAVPGETAVVATLGSFSARALLRVIAAELTEIRITPALAMTGIGGTVRFTAEGAFDDGSVIDLSSSVGWATSSEDIASINDSGVAIGNGSGDAIITARFMGLEAEAVLVVSGASLSRIEVAPVDPTLAVGVVQRFTATGIYSDGTTADLTETAVWSSTEPEVATIDATGQVTTLIAGETLIRAAADGRRGQSLLTVTGATLTGVSIEPAELTLGAGESSSLRASAQYSDGSTMDVTESATWASTMLGVAEVSNAAGTKGRVSGIAVGSTRVTATFEGITGTADVTVSGAELELIAIAPEVGMASAGGTVAYRAVGRYFDGIRRTYRTITTSVTWTTADGSVASISNALGTEGVATGVRAGSTTVTATLGAVSGRAMIVITDAALSSIAISPADATTTAGLRTEYRAEATYSDGTTADVTSMVMWATGDSSIATISNAAGIEGQLLARDEGRTTVTATVDGITGSTTVTVTAATPVELQVTPVGASVPVGGSLQYQAVVVYSDGTSRNVTRMASWSSSRTSVATMGSGRFGIGRATAEGVGTTTITARAEGLTGSQTLTVTAAEIASISITPATWSTSVGEERRFTAQAIYTDGTIMDVTAAGTWTSSNTRVAEVSNAFRFWGVVSTVGAGTTEIRMTYMGLSGSATVTVSAATITEIQVTPFTRTVAAGTTVQYQAVAIFSDGTSRNVTTDVTWTSSNTSVAAISNARGSWGRATTLTAGTARISATYMGMTTTVTLTVTAAVLDRIQVTPFIPDLPVGLVLFMQATAIYTDGSTMNVTNTATWTSSDPAVAAVSNARGSKGMVTALTGGTTDIQATFDGVTGSTRVTVIDSPLRSITVSPSTATVGVGETQPFMATGNYADGTVFDLTRFVTWSSSDVRIADVSNAFFSWGQATGFSAGTVTVTARLDATSGTASLTVR